MPFASDVCVSVIGEDMNRLPPNQGMYKLQISCGTSPFTPAVVTGASCSLGYRMLTRLTHVRALIVRLPVRRELVSTGGVVKVVLALYVLMSCMNVLDFEDSNFDNRS